ncbi:hypothetical protein L207DRAFT_578559 [Hyaloscypha variabilis F]|uniref:Apple domain-containing protein n=1 Tax=Hyaloscypha variabilis (strain UAMH 11265 / GT02V1 / F) TaxID=1149755 RepID=A0A2J6S4F4_HYAVF|nr:hypothetical protein L207DRAFT_578559 [Hyaloscypha variabilis F]
MRHIIEMLLLRSFGLFISATVSLAARFPHRGNAGESISPMITGRDLSAPSLVSGAAGTDKEKPAACSGPHASSAQDCLAKCRASSSCQSVAFDSSASACLLYKAPVSGNINYDASQAYLFYDLSCPQAGETGVISVVTLTVTGAPIIATSTVVVIVTAASTLPPSTASPSTSTLVVIVTVTQGALSSSPISPIIETSIPTTQSSTSISTSTSVVFVTVTQGIPINSTSGPATDTVYISQPVITSSLLNPPTSTALASTLSTATTSTVLTSSSAVLPSPTPSGLLCGVSGWSSANTSFFDNTGHLGNQYACALACKVVSCGSYGFSNTTCLAYPGSVSQSVILTSDSTFLFYDAGCIVSHR